MEVIHSAALALAASQGTSCLDKFLAGELQTMRELGFPNSHEAFKAGLITRQEFLWLEQEERYSPWR